MRDREVVRSRIFAVGQKFRVVILNQLLTNDLQRPGAGWKARSLAVKLARDRQPVAARRLSKARRIAMPLLVIRHKVKDYAAWRKIFDGHKQVQTAAGLSNPRVYRSADDANEVVVLMDAADIGKAKQFGASADLKSTMQTAGVVDQPTVYFLNSTA
jgi:hypothetical protein